MVDSFIDEFGKPQPDPGGGAAAAYGAMVALALLKKVCLLERRRATEDAAAQALWDRMLGKVETLSAEMLKLREADRVAYKRLTQARLGSAGANCLIAAILHAVEVPMRIMQTCQEALNKASQAGGLCLRHLVPDVQVACELLAGAITGSYHIALYNVPLLEDAPGQLAKLREVLALCEKDVGAAREHLKAGVEVSWEG